MSLPEWWIGCCFTQYQQYFSQLSAVCRVDSVLWWFVGVSCSPSWDPLTWPLWWHWLLESEYSLLRQLLISTNHSSSFKVLHTQGVMYLHASFSLSHPLSQTLTLINQRRKFSMILNFLLLPEFFGHSCWPSYLLFLKTCRINISAREDRGGSVWRG